MYSQVAKRSCHVLGSVKTVVPCTRECQNGRTMYSGVSKRSRRVLAGVKTVAPCARDKYPPTSSRVERAGEGHKQLARAGAGAGTCAGGAGGAGGAGCAGCAGGAGACVGGGGAGGIQAGPACFL